MTTPVGRSLKTDLANLSDQARRLDTAIRSAALSDEDVAVLAAKAHEVAHVFLHLSATLKRSQL